VDMFNAVRHSKNLKNPTPIKSYREREREREKEISGLVGNAEKFQAIQRGCFIGATTLCIMTLSIMTLSIMTLSIMTLSIMTLSIMTLSIMTLSIMTFSIMTLCTNGL
jgi:hypothetical protein